VVYGIAQWLQSTRLSNTIQSVDWIIPTVQSIHIVTIALVFGSLLTIALRVLGRVRTDQPFPDVLGRFTPWIRNGLVVLASTGLVLLIGEPVRELMSMSFWVKMVLLALGIGSAAALCRSVERHSAGGDQGFSPAARWGAVATVVLWLLIIFLGRAIAYDVEVWGPLSLSPRA
jgi:lysylphosphatidylglycerol synthetase-like protein (DUF2156 family)